MFSLSRIIIFRVLFVLFIFEINECQAQFLGGKNDGFTTTINHCTAPATVFLGAYSGGANDGFSLAKLICPATPVSGIVPYVGGYKSGFTVLTQSCPVLTSSSGIYFGGKNSGFSFKQLNCTILPLPLIGYYGGKNSGYSFNTTECTVSMSLVMYYGGENSGFSSSSLSCVSTLIAPTAYMGGKFDGFSSAKFDCPTIVPSGIIPYTGGKNDGFARGGKECLPVGSPANISFGGVYSGFSTSKLLCQPVPYSSVLYLGGEYHNGVATSSFSTSCAVIAPLPINLIYFKSICTAQQVQLLWEVQSQVNNDYFTIEKSSNGLFFEPLAIVNGDGTSTQSKNYSFIDETPYEEQYYRLSQTDFDGKTTFYDLIYNSCTKAKRELEIKIYPNPNNGYFVIDGVEATDIVIYNTVGEYIKTIYSNLYRMEFDLSDFPKGVYIIQFIKKGNITMKKVVVN